VEKPVQCVVFLKASEKSLLLEKILITIILGFIKKAFQFIILKLFFLGRLL
jgi:hypothetical protein